MSRPLALVTGGAGLIGSHLADLLLTEGWRVRILDNLEPVTHPAGAPAWLPRAADVRIADVRDRAALRDALDGVEVVFHQAAYGGYMPELAKYMEVNAGGTGRLLETIGASAPWVRKVVVASSQAVYQEGAARCDAHGRVFPEGRDPIRMAAGDFAVRCPVCDAPAASVPTPEEAPTGGDTAYAISKCAEERLALAWSRGSGVPVVALRYSCTYGPRQSLANPYTGLIAIFATRLVNGLAPVVYEDGRQTRDLGHVRDVARANLVAAGTDALDGRAVNVGSGVATSVAEVAELVADALGVPRAAELPGEFRPGEMRHLVADTTRLRATGWEPTVGLAEGVAEYLDWVRRQGDVRERFTAAATLLRRSGVVRPVHASA